jgi:hypothetical protein
MSVAEPRIGVGDVIAPQRRTLTKDEFSAIADTLAEHARDH